MDIFEIAKRKFGAPFGIFAMTIVNSEVPFGEFSDAVRPNKVVFGFSGRLIFVPATFLVGNEMAVCDQLFGETERVFVKVDVVPWCE